MPSATAMSGELIIGGAERADSVRAGLAAIEADIVLVHDAARPFCPPGVIDRLLDCADDARRGGSGAAGRRHAGAGRRDPGRAGRPRAGWSGSRPRRRSSFEAWLTPMRNGPGLARPTNRPVMRAAGR